METFSEELDTQIAYEVEYLNSFGLRNGWSEDYTKGYIDGLHQAMAMLKDQQSH